MRDQLIQYVNLLFAGVKDCEEIKQEILQNTLDRYDDLIAEGKVPEAAYRLAITGIGDINEILGSSGKIPAAVYSPAAESQTEKVDSPIKKVLRAAAVFLYILCPTPLFILSEMGMDTIGLCATLSIVAVATVLMILGAKKEIRKEKAYAEERSDPRTELEKSISHVISAVGVAIYFIVSFATGAWYVTWVIFPIVGAVQGLAKAILDLKETVNNEE